MRKKVPRISLFCIKILCLNILFAIADHFSYLSKAEEMEIMNRNGQLLMLFLATTMFATSIISGAGALETLHTVYPILKKQDW